MDNDFVWCIEIKSVSIEFHSLHFKFNYLRYWLSLILLSPFNSVHSPTICEEVCWNSFPSYLQSFQIVQDKPLMYNMHSQNSYTPNKLPSLDNLWPYIIISPRRHGSHTQQVKTTVKERKNQSKIVNSNVNHHKRSKTSWYKQQSVSQKGG